MSDGIIDITSTSTFSKQKYISALSPAHLTSARRHIGTRAMASGNRRLPMCTPLVKYLKHRKREVLWLQTSVRDRTRIGRCQQITHARTRERFLDGQSLPKHTLCRPRSSRRSKPSTRPHQPNTSQAYQDSYHTSAYLARPGCT